MNTKLLALVAFLIALTPMVRADINVSIQETLIINNSLPLLDNVSIAGRPEHPAYHFSTETMWRIVDLKLALAIELEKARTVLAALETQHPDREKNPEAKAAFDKEYKSLTEKIIHLKCAPLKRADFDLDKNPIPPDLLVALAPITIQ